MFILFFGLSKKNPILRDIMLQNFVVFLFYFILFLILIFRVWSDVVQYNKGRIPALIVQQINSATTTTDVKMLVHIRDLLETINSIWERENDAIVIQEQLEKEEEKKLAGESIQAKVQSYQ